MAENSQVQRGLRVVRGIQAAIATEPAMPDAVVLPPATTTAATETVEPPTAFVSWAHSHPSWKPQQTSDWESQVAAFARLLRNLGIAAEVDLFHLDEPQDWTRFGQQQLQSAKFTLIVMSHAWADRWSGANSPRVGAGAAAEADTLKGLFTQDQEAWQRRVVIVMFPDVGWDSAPPDLQRVTRVAVDPADPDSFDLLIRILTAQPRYPMPPVGKVPVLSAAAGYEESTELAKLRDRLTDIEKRRSELADKSTEDADAEREHLYLSEAATRGFIDAELTIET